MRELRLTLSPTQRRVIRQAAETAERLSNLDFTAIRSVTYSQQALSTSIGGHTFLNRLIAASGRLSRGRPYFDGHHLQIDASVLRKDNDCIEMSLDEADRLVWSLEIFLRLHLGQIQIAIEGLVTATSPEGQEVIRDLSDLCSASFGIHSPEIHEDARIAYDIRQTLRHYLAWSRHPEGGLTRDFDKPLRTSAVALPRITTVAA
ncbi:hypothetical protein [Microvirga tunisiensis]|uniref:Uncharacterized protein n=1 Tax=Microvirga tunisiensis TaxID=2108360 RepID=A0A5N7MP52_9HYPH|nr:hypothetical protein [Microvirga tunisiensis]MPR11493.1 hypothetical protein [Microvirga tunisiensis]MPR28618.1 hypothetical protein [Microvirga tunisiensis]